MKKHTHTHKNTIREARLTLHECLENTVTKRVDPHIVIIIIIVYMLNLQYRCTDKQPSRPWTDGQTQHVTRPARNSIFESLSACDRSRIGRIERSADRSQSIRRIFTYIRHVHMRL